MKNKRLNIVYVCREFGPVTGGGIGTYIYNACMAMAARGHGVFLLTDCFHEGNLELLPEGIQLVAPLATRNNRTGSFVSPHHEYSYRVYDTLKEFASKEHLDVVEFAEFGVEGFASIRGKRLLGDFAATKLVVKLHTPSSLLYQINEDRRLHVDSLCDYTMEDYCVTYADMVTSPSLSLGQYFEKRVGRQDILQCPYPMELPSKGKARRFTEKQVRRVRLIGSIQVRKGIDTFIKAAVKVLRHDADFLFEIWGADRNALLFGKKYSDITRRLIPDDLQEKIVFAGEVPYSEIPALFNDSCFCVYPSRWENWANVCLEAMSYGCVVLASKNGGMSEMIEHGKSGFVIDPLDPDDIAETILGHYKKNTLLEEISHCAVLRSSEICNPQSAAEAIENNYRHDFPQKEEQKVGADTPLVSVIIPYYNQPQYLGETVASVVASDYPNIEIVVVNDGSSTVEAREVFAALSGVVKVSKENGGLSSARNAGIEAAKGEFVLPLDADDLVERDYIRKGVEALRNNPELGYVSCHAQNFGEINNAYIPVGYVPELMPYINTHGKCSNLYRKSLFAQYGGYDEVMTSYEDWDYLLTLHEYGVEGDVLPDEMFRYRRHYDSMVYVTANRQRTDLIQYMMIKHETALAPHAAKMAIMLARLWKETEMKAESLELQLQNAYLRPARIGSLQPGAGSRLQVYAHGGEVNSVFVDYPEQQWVDLRLNLPFEGDEVAYRFDPANSHGTLVIQDIVIREKKFGRALFKASSANGFSRCAIEGDVEYKMQKGFLVMEARDDDPQILLPRLPNAASLLMDVRLYYTSESGCDVPAIIDLFSRNRLRGTLRKIASRFFGTC